MRNFLLSTYERHFGKDIRMKFFMVSSVKLYCLLLLAWSTVCGAIVLDDQHCAAHGDICQVCQAGFPCRKDFFINDYAGVITPEYVTKIREVAERFYARKGAVIAILTINSLNDYPKMGCTTIESFAQAVVKKWDIQKNGLYESYLIVVAVKDKRVRIQKRNVCTNHRRCSCGSLQCAIDYFMVPSFKKGLYGNGIYEGALWLVEQECLGNFFGELLFLLWGCFILWRFFRWLYKYKYGEVSIAVICLMFFIGLCVFGVCVFLTPILLGGLYNFFYGRWVGRGGGGGGGAGGGGGGGCSGGASGGW